MTKPPDINQLTTDVALTKQKVEYIEKSVNQIEKKIDLLSFVPIHEFELFRTRTEISIKELQDINDKNYIGAFFANLLGSKALTIMAGAMILAAVYYAVKGGIK